MIGGMSWPSFTILITTHRTTTDKGRARVVVCWLLINLISLGEHRVKLNYYCLFVRQALAAARFYVSSAESYKKNRFRLKKTKEGFLTIKAN